MLFEAGRNDTFVLLAPPVGAAIRGPAPGAAARPSGLALQRLQGRSRAASDLRPRRLVREVDPGFFEADRLEQLHELVAVDLALLDHRVGDLLHLLAVR